MLRYALISRTGSGKKTFLNELDKAGIKIARSHTTRERNENDPNDRFHIFGENDVADDAKLLATKHNDIEYFYTMDELKDAVIIPIDPENFANLAALFPSDAFRFIQLIAKNEDRLMHAVDKLPVEEKLTGEEDFKALCFEENAEFEKFEDAVKNNKLNVGRNVRIGHNMLHDFTEDSDIYTWAATILSNVLAYNRTVTIIHECADAGIITRNGDKFVSEGIDAKGKRTIHEEVPEGVFVEMTLAQPLNISAMMGMWLRLEGNSFKKSNKEKAHLISVVNK